MTVPTVSIINASTVVTDDEAHAVTNALRTQVRRDFAHSAWQTTCRVGFVPKGHRPPTKTWHLYVLDDSDTAGALGYHDLTPEGLPAGKIFARTDQQYGIAWSGTASHELLEMLGDPDINRTAQTTDPDGTTVAWALEDCDACEDEQFGYEIDGIKVSDFVFPNFWVPGSAGPWDLNGHISAPLQILPGGYLSRWTAAGGWVQVYGDKAKPGDRAKVGSRRERRGVPRAHWLASETRIFDGLAEAYVEPRPPQTDH